ncbi:hypothetical protein CsSME_00010323 [Camellia sinensis var. sinensis]
MNSIQILRIENYSSALFKSLSCRVWGKMSHLLSLETAGLAGLAWWQGFGSWGVLPPRVAFFLHFPSIAFAVQKLCAKAASLLQSLHVLEGTEGSVITA